MWAGETSGNSESREKLTLICEAKTRTCTGLSHALAKPIPWCVITILWYVLCVCIYVLLLTLGTTLQTSGFFNAFQYVVLLLIVLLLRCNQLHPHLREEGLPHIYLVMLRAHPVGYTKCVQIKSLWHTLWYNGGSLEECMRFYRRSIC